MVIAANTEQNRTTRFYLDVGKYIHNLAVPSNMVGSHLMLIVGCMFWSSVCKMEDSRVSKIVFLYCEGYSQKTTNN